MFSSPADRRDLEQLVAAGRAGDAAAVGRLLDRYRDYLRSIARRRLSRTLDRRFDASDMVQQTFLDAHQNFANFAGSEEPELLAWLRRILRCNLANAIRDHSLAQKRAVSGEQPLEAADGRLAAGTPSPSRKLIRHEESLRLLAALEQLPADQASAVRLRYLAGLSIAEIAAEMDRSPTAAAGLIKRGMEGLRRCLSVDEGDRR